MPNHECETFEFPVMQGALNYRARKTIVAALGGTWQLAVRDVIDEAKRKAQEEGEAAMRNERCAKPCEGMIYVEVSIDRIVPRWRPGKQGKEIVVPITGRWQAGILCFKPAPEPHQ